MTEFTDDDLKRLKDYVDITPAHFWDKAHIKALLARLEAAEKALNEIVGMHGSDSIDAWRKAAGKPQSPFF